MVIAELYAALEELDPSPVVALNRTVALAMATTPQAGLELLAKICALDLVEPGREAAPASEQGLPPLTGSKTSLSVSSSAIGWRPCCERGLERRSPTPALSATGPASHTDGKGDLL
ncbi:hypothetical protein [Actinosynnema sp. ALI-1.44]|uniref:hypothetical protein n=1 Tax=Actinosynnema sp. ALI-1.44 TaxID=1933779 RepID=UPI001177EFD6|nr:hypothetical protein [Actinosynnema sp. ALI-1.44]